MKYVLPLIQGAIRRPTNCVLSESKQRKLNKNRMAWGLENVNAHNNPLPYAQLPPGWNGREPPTLCCNRGGRPSLSLSVKGRGERVARGSCPPCCIWEKRWHFTFLNDYFKMIRAQKNISESRTSRFEPFGVFKLFAVLFRNLQHTAPTGI